MDTHGINFDGSSSEDGHTSPDDRNASSDYASGLSEESFCSLTSSVNAHFWEYGRRYHTYQDGRYPLPNDDDEYKREAFKGAMFKEMLHGKLFLAPIGRNPQKIIDLGTGFGDWAIEMGDTYPTAKVIGVDLSPIQPIWGPPNVEFRVDNIEDEWPHGSDFDYVHSRSVFIFLKNLLKLMANAYRHLKPGGWIELLDFSCCPSSDDGSLTPDNPMVKFWDVTRDIFLRLYGFDFTAGKKLATQLQESGFVNIHQSIHHVPFGEWPKDKHLRTIGAYGREVLEDLLLAMAARPFSEAGMEKAGTDKLLQGAQSVLRDKRVHAYFPAYVVWAQKPI